MQYKEKGWYCTILGAMFFNLLCRIVPHSAVFYRSLPYLVARVTLSMSLKVSPILSFVRPVTTICK